MQNFLNIIQIVIAALLITCILLQQRGSGLGAAFGGEGNIYMAKRGAEKIVFIATIVLSIVFLGLGVLRLFV